MKKIRKVIGMILSMLMLWTTTVSLAAEQYTIRVLNARQNETYRIYRMMDAVANAAMDSYSYTIASGWDAFFAEWGAGKDYITMENGYVVSVDEARIEQFGKAAAEYVRTASPSEAASSLTAPSNQTIVFELSSPGYYLITSTAGTLTAIQTTPQSKTVTVTEKTLNSVISCEQLGTAGTTVMIGTPVQYQDRLTLQKGALNEILHLDLSDGMSLSQIDSITVNGTPLTVDTDYVIVNDPSDDTCDLHIRFTQDWLDQISEPTVVMVKFTVYLNGDAAAMPEVETMKTWLSDGAATVTKPVNKTLSTLFFDLIKIEYESEEELAGAQFELFTTAADGEKIALVKDGEGLYHVADPKEKSAENFTSAIIEAGKARITGFSSWSTVYLEEIKAPTGYNKVGSRIEVSFQNENRENFMEGTTWTEDDGGIGVVNHKGALLPDTGGSGNTFFYIFGGALCMIGGILVLRLSTMEKE